MYKIKRIICPACGRIKEKKENDFFLDVLSGEIKEECILRDDKIINGIEFCAVCR